MVSLTLLVSPIHPFPHQDSLSLLNIWLGILLTLVVVHAFTVHSAEK